MKIDTQLWQNLVSQCVLFWRHWDTEVVHLKTKWFLSRYVKTSTAPRSPWEHSVEWPERSQIGASQAVSWGQRFDGVPSAFYITLTLTDRAISLSPLGDATAVIVYAAYFCFQSISSFVVTVETRLRDPERIRHRRVLFSKRVFCVEKVNFSLF